MGMPEFSLCHFCQSSPMESESCDWCECGSEFRTDTSAIIDKAEELGISVSDVIALIEIENKYGK